MYSHILEAIAGVKLKQKVFERLKSMKTNMSLRFLNFSFRGYLKRINTGH